MKIHCHHPAGRKSVLYRQFIILMKRGICFTKQINSSICFLTVVKKSIQVEEVNVDMLF